MSTVEESMNGIRNGGGLVGVRALVAAALATARARRDKAAIGSTSFAREFALVDAYTHVISLLDMATTGVDFVDLLRSIDDATTGGMNLDQAKVTMLAHGTASYLARRGVRFALDGEPFEPGALSPERVRRLIEERGVAEELWPDPRAIR